MKITRLRCKNYKAFKELQEVKLKPITVLIGKNSSGKSAIARLPLLLAQSLLNSSTSPIELQFDGFEFGGSFKDLVHNKIDHGSITLGLTLGDESEEIELDFVVQNIADSPIQLISSYKIKSNRGFNLQLAWDFDHAEKKHQLYFSEGSYSGKAKVEFRGLLIDRIIDDEFKIDVLKDEIDALNSKIAKTMSCIDYVGSFRDTPKRDYIYKGGLPRYVGHSGQFAPHILGINSHSDRAIIEKVSTWYKENLGGWKLDIQNVRDKFEIVLISPDDSNVKINLVDVGHGMSQVLPLIVRSFSGSTTNDTLMVIEQPELHLHPASHGPLAELFAGIIQVEQSNWLVETHSEVFILRLRRLIAEGKISANDVTVLLVDDEKRPGSTLKVINIDDTGEVDFWPTGVFSEDYSELIAIRRAQNQGK